jgi:zinc protease
MTWTLDVEHPLGRLTLRRYTWPTGLRVILARDPAAPILSYQTWLRVGSAHETPGQTGMAHFFEHLMFNATEHRAQGEIDRLIEATGGDTNAATWVDWTFYRDTVPADALPLVVELEADRLQHLALDDGPIESEREVVISERLERVEDDIDGFLDEALCALAFTRHPYRWPTIGWMHDIRALARPDIERFYRTFYAPNNATLVIVGDIDEAQTLALLAEHYGDIPASPIPARETVVEPAQLGERRRVFTKPVPSPRLVCGYQIPGQGHPDWPVLEFIAALMSDGPSARLYRRLVIETEIATTLEASALPFRDPSLFRVSATVARGHTADEVLAELDRAFAKLAEAPVAAAELTKVKNCAETYFWSLLESCDGKAEQLGHFETTLGDFRALFELERRLAAITPDEITRVARTYLGPAGRSVCIAEPGGDAGPDDSGGDAGPDDSGGDSSDGGDLADDGAAS